MLFHNSCDALRRRRRSLRRCHVDGDEVDEILGRINVLRHFKSRGIEPVACVRHWAKVRDAPTRE